MRQTIKQRFISTGLIVGVVLFVMASVSIAASAAPASPFAAEHQQADGTLVSLVNRGDEFFNWTEDEEGYIVAYDAESANWCYAQVEDNDAIVPGEKIVGKSWFANLLKRGNKQKADELTSLLENVSRPKGQRKNAPVNNGAAPPDSGVGQGGVNPAEHSKNRQQLLVLLVEYSNRQFTTSYAEDTTAYWSNHFFGSTGKTVNTYYKEVSGSFDLQYIMPAFTKEDDTTITAGLPSGVSSVLIKDGVVKVRLSKNHPNTTAFGGAVETDVGLAFHAVKQYMSLSDLPKTGNTILCEDLNITSVIAGFDASGSSSTPSVWAHANWWYWNNVNGKQRNYSVDYGSNSSGILRSYAAHGELYNASTPMPIGVSAHELGHLLGLPDLYSYIGGDGIGAFSLMAGGSWGTDTAGDTKRGNTPTHPDAWSKARLGFSSPVTVSSASYWKNNINSFANVNGYSALKITSIAAAPQYFLVENRQLSGYDRGLGGLGKTDSGILIYHVDERVLDGSGGRENDNNYHKAIDLEKYPDNPCYEAGGVFNAASAPNSNFHTVGHTVNLTTHTDCHPQTLASGVQLKINSASGDAMEVEAGLFAAVTNITDVPTTAVAGTPFMLSGTVVPSNAANKTIVWSVYSAGTTGASISGSSILNTTAVGTVTVRATILNGAAPGTNYTQNFTIAVSGARELTPAAAIHYQTERFTGLVPGENYTVKGLARVANAAGEIDIEEAWMNGTSLAIVKLGKGTATADSLPQTVTIPARPAKPIGLSGIAPTAIGGTNGKINGTTAAMEYRAAGADAWTNCAAASTTVGAAGSYEVRIKAAVGTSFKSAAAAVSVPATQMVDKTGLNARINELKGTGKGNYTDASWNAFQSALSSAQTAANNASATQAQVDDALKALNTACNNLQAKKMIANTQYESNPLNWVLMILCFGWIWMWF